MNIVAWLQNLGLQQYEQAFRDNAIDAGVLPELTAEDLREIGVGLVGHRRKLLAAIAALRADGKSEPAAERREVIDTAAAERRQLTVMFSDLVGSTALSARLDPEDLREIIVAYQRSVAEIINESDGFIAKYMGDGVLIYFGYPQAHEDDAEQAIRAGLGLIEAVARLDVGSVELQARVGIATGLVIVGDLIGEGSAQEQSVVGETPNLAARLQALAEPGAVVVAASTRRLVGNLFEYRDLGAVEVKGLAAPVPAWQVLRPRAVASRFEALHGSALSPLIGRDEEIDLLLRRWARAKAGDGQIVLISGEPGIGKSRLTAALQEHLQAEVHAHIRYFCSPHRQDSPLHPVISCLEHIAGFTGDDGPDRRLDKLAAMLVSVGAAQSDISSIAEFMSLPGGTRYPPPELSPQRKRERILAALVRQLEGLARQQPLLITFEDLHWIDPSSRELLDQIAARIGQLPVLLVATCRPEFELPWTGLSQMTLVVLNRLSRNDGAAMVRQLSTDTAPLPQDVANEIVERADGVPLFVEELTRSVIEASVDQAPASSRAIPSTLQASLLARIDRLGFATKQVAQVAAAIRREFSLELLTASGQLPASVIGDGLERLIDASLVFQLGASPHATFVFKHTLIQDIVYGTMLRQQRRELHGNIATALEQYFPDRVASEPELLAQHFAEAGVIDKSADYFLLAGQVAIQRSAMTEAVAHLRKGVNVLSGAPDDTTRRERELNLQVSLARALIATKGYAAPEPGEAYARVRQLCEQLNRPPPLGPGLGGRFAIHLVRGELEQAELDAAEIRYLAEAANDRMWLSAGSVTGGNACFYLGKFDDARAYHEKALALWDPLYRAAVVVPEDPLVVNLTFLSRTLACLGYVDQARSQRNEALAEAQRLSSFSLIFALCAGWQVDWAIDRMKSSPAMLRSAEQVLAITSEQGYASWVATGNIMRGWCLSTLGRVAEGIPLLLQGVAAVGASGAKLVMPQYLTILAEAYGLASQPEEGLRQLVYAEQLMETTQERWAEAEMHRLRGTLLLSMHEQAAAEDSYCTALAVARRQSAKLWELRAALDISHLWRSQGKTLEARDVLVPVCDWFTEGVDVPVLLEARALL